MGVLEQDDVQTLEIRESLDSLSSDGLQEAVARRVEETAGTASPLRADGLVPLYIIRPGVGRGRGKHLYEADMLQREVADGRFTGWKMYVDHQAPEAKKASGGLPRSIRDLGGFIKEAWWDATVPADPAKGHAQGAVVGLAKPTRLMRDLIEDIPEAIGASISAQATAVRPVQRGGEQVWLVEGIRPRGSVDFVTEAGAGGKVVNIMESLDEADLAEEEAELMFEGKSEDEILEWFVDNRPDVLEVLLEAGDGNDSEADGDDDDVMKKYLKKFKGNRKMAAMAAKREKAAQEGRHDHEGGQVDIETTLREALESDEGQKIIAEAIASGVREQFAAIVAPALAELVEAALADERELIQAEANATAERQLQVRDMRDAAHKQIAESGLPEPFQAELREKFDIVDGKPTPALNIIEDRDSESDAVTKTAEEKLSETVEADLERKREQAAAANPTKVRGQGETRPAKPKNDGEGGEVEEGKKDEPASTGSPKTDALLTESGIDADDELYAGITG